MEPNPVESDSSPSSDSKNKQSEEDQLADEFNKLKLEEPKYVELAEVTP